jgi:hypothetical protein
MEVGAVVWWTRPTSNNLVEYILHEVLIRENAHKTSKGHKFLLEIEIKKTNSHWKALGERNPIMHPKICSE